MLAGVVKKSDPVSRLFTPPRSEVNELLNKVLAPKLVLLTEDFLAGQFHACLSSNGSLAVSSLFAFRLAVVEWFLVGGRLSHSGGWFLSIIGCRCVSGPSPPRYWYSRICRATWDRC